MAHYTSVCKISLKAKYTGPAGTYAWLNVWDPDAKKTMEGVAIPANTVKKYAVVRAFAFDTPGSYNVYFTLTGNGKLIDQNIWLDVT